MSQNLHYAMRLAMKCYSFVRVGVVGSKTITIHSWSECSCGEANVTSTENLQGHLLFDDEHMNSKTAHLGAIQVLLVNQMTCYQSPAKRKWKCVPNVVQLFIHQKLVLFKILVDIENVESVLFLKKMVVPHAKKNQHGLHVNLPLYHKETENIVNKHGTKETNIHIEEAPVESKDSQKNKEKKRTKLQPKSHIKVLSSIPVEYCCTVCNKTFSNRLRLRYHNFCGSDDKPYTCELCYQTFISRSHYEYHLRNHAGIKPYICDICDKGFNQKGKLTRHIRSHTGLMEKGIMCVRNVGRHTRSLVPCALTFTHTQARRGLFAHIVARSLPNVSTSESMKLLTQYYAVCASDVRAVLPTTFYRTHSGLSWLWRVVSTPAARAMPSLVLASSSVTGTRHARHSYDRSLGITKPTTPYLLCTGEKAVVCDQCGKKFGYRWLLILHQRTHSQERPHQCPVCSRAFCKKQDMKRHHLTHTCKFCLWVVTIKSFECTTCNMLFRRKDNLERHLKNTHLDQTKTRSSKLEPHHIKDKPPNLPRPPPRCLEDLLDLPSSVQSSNSSTHCSDTQAVQINNALMFKQIEPQTKNKGDGGLHLSPPISWAIDCQDGLRPRMGTATGYMCVGS
uniref:C2H2-type domain-containing protein n=1 Tax=Timema bartmani TaxID=61472 RepID=A0A7R9HVE6_9NEOP|nr:unnamed protein product [Timema bartmani]